MKLLILLGVLFLVKAMVLECVCVWISLGVIFAIKTLEGMWTQFLLLSFKTRKVCFEVGFAVPTKVIVVFGFVRSITFYTLRPLKVAHEHGVTLLPAIFTLWDAKIHISSSYRSNETFYIKALVNDFLGWRSILWVLNIDLDNSHIRLGQNFTYL